jgi:hypothetical protein
VLRGLIVDGGYSGGITSPPIFDGDYYRSYKGLTGEGMAFPYLPDIYSVSHSSSNTIKRIKTNNTITIVTTLKSSMAISLIDPIPTDVLVDIGSILQA